MRSSSSVCDQTPVFLAFGETKNSSALLQRLRILNIAWDIYVSLTPSHLIVIWAISLTTQSSSFSTYGHTSTQPVSRQLFQPHHSTSSVTMYKQLFTVLLLVSLSLSLQPKPRSLPVDLLARQSTSCESDGSICGDSCMPTNANCCNDGSSTFCLSGEYCVTGGCCDDGEVCSGGGGGTLTFTGPIETNPSSSSSGSGSGSGQSTAAAADSRPLGEKTFALGMIIMAGYFLFLQRLG